MEDAEKFCAIPLEPRPQINYFDPTGSKAYLKWIWSGRSRWPACDGWWRTSSWGLAALPWLCSDGRVFSRRSAPR